MATEATPPKSRGPAIGLLIAVWLAFNFPVLAAQVKFPTDFADLSGVTSPNTAGKAERRSNPVDGDAYFALYPWQSHLGMSLAEGRLPLWDPHRFLGSPFAANIATGTWYPPNWLYASGHILAVSTLLLLATQLATLLMAYWFFRVIRLHPFAAAGGAITFVYSGFLIGWGQHGLITSSASWLPLALGGVEVARRGRTRLGIPLAGAALALSVMSGHAQVSLYVWMAVALWIVVATIAGAAEVRHQGRQAVVRQVMRGSAIVLAAFGIGAALASLPILGVAEFARHSVRQTRTYSDLLASALPLEHWGTLLMPDYLGNPLDGNYAGSSNYTERSWYVGIIGLLLAVLALIRRRDRATLYFGLLGAFGVLAAFGTPLARLLYSAVPGIAFTSSLPRFSFLVDVGLAGLAALGLDSMLAGSGKSRRLDVVIPAVILSAFVLALTLSRAGTPVTGEYLRPKGIAALALVASATLIILVSGRNPSRLQVGAMALVSLVGIDLWLFGFRYHPYESPRPIYPVSPEIERLASLPGPRPRFIQVDDRERWSLPFNAALVHGLFSVNGYDPFIPTRFVELIGLAQDQRENTLENWIRPFTTHAARSPVMQLLGVTAFVQPSPQSPGGSFVGPFLIGNAPDPAPTAILAPCWEVVPRGSVLPRLERMSISALQTTAVAEESPLARRLLGTGRGGCRPEEPPTTEAQPVIDSYRPEEIVVRTPPSAGGVLILTDQWYPGWKATVDGRPSPILRVDHAVRGVVLGDGPHRVEFTYQPWWFPWGVAITAGAALITALWVVAPSLRPAASRSAVLPEC